VGKEGRMSIFLEAALEYASMGYSVIPVVEGDKKPKIKWQEFQTRKATVEEITAWWTKWPKANVGIVTGAISELCVVDLDRYKPGYDQTIELEYFPDSLITPSAITPRGGSHLYFLGPPDPISGGADILPGIDLRAEGNFIVAPPSQNGSGHSYKWAEGHKLSQLALAACPVLFLKKALKEKTIDNKSFIGNLYAHGELVDSEKTEEESLQPSTSVHNVYKSGRRDEDLFHLANALVKSKCHPEFIQKTLEIIAVNCEPPFPVEEVKIKIVSAMKRAHDKERNIMAEVKEWVLSTNGIFLSTNLQNDLQLSTREQKKNVSICLKRLSLPPEKLIEKYGNRNGCFRKIDDTEEIIDYKDIDLRPYDIKLPLGIMEKVEINKGNIIVVAGESNAGKTAFLLNVAIDNCLNHKVNYMSSEMNDGVELRRRLNKFNLHIDAWDPIKFQFRTDCFPDKIDPHGLNIVDYLDEGSEAEAYRMPMRLREIADKLKSGIALVSIQKDPNKIYGYGGSGTLNRSRLYLTITTENILTIVKAKIWRDDFSNPNGSFCKFKLAAGSKFKMEGGWSK
jgi:hypothetical protein